VVGILLSTRFFVGTDFAAAGDNTHDSDDRAQIDDARALLFAPSCLVVRAGRQIRRWWLVSRYGKARLAAGLSPKALAKFLGTGKDFTGGNAMKHECGENKGHLLLLQQIQ